MSDTSLATAQLSRRGLLKVGLFGTALLVTAGATATLSGCSSATPASGYAVLRLSDLPFLRALIPVVLQGAVAADGMPAAIATTLKGMDRSLNSVSPELLKLTQQLFDVLGMAVTRGPLTGIWGSWDNASPAEVRHFLNRWQNSSLDLLRMGHNSLLQMVQMAWYAQPESWGHCGYPGPPPYAL
ncbi:MAG TPA: twin-arginine translocation pathway signal protein [Pseudomonas sp.]|nr:twin-arginine translocation pathway signal protein [Pseudomonas sp.]